MSLDLRFNKGITFLIKIIYIFERKCQLAPRIVIGNTDDLLLDQLCEHTFVLDDLYYRQLVLDKKRKIIRNGILNDNFQYEEQALIWRGIHHEKLIGQTIRDALKKKYPETHEPHEILLNESKEAFGYWCEHSFCFECANSYTTCQIDRRKGKWLDCGHFICNICFDENFACAKEHKSDLKCMECNNTYYYYDV
jgi:hypothetical protein